MEAKRLTDRLADALLMDPNGINEDAYETLLALVYEVNRPNGDVALMALSDRVDATDGRFYFPEDEDYFEPLDDES